MNDKREKMKKIITPVNILQVFAWLIVVTISLFALKQSSESNKKAENSNKIAEESLVSSQRPYLAIVPRKYEENDSFIFAKETTNGIELKTKFELINNGNSIAKDIKTSDMILTQHETLNTEPQIILENKINCEKPGTISLAPSESVFIEIGGETPILDKRAVIDVLEKIKKNEFSFPFALEVYYSSDLEHAIRGKTAVSLVIQPENVEIKYTVMD
ncbi:MAG: hypothetical protein AAB779_02975 [Patescibacteria group bacterium]